MIKDFREDADRLVEHVVVEAGKVPHPRKITVKTIDYCSSPDKYRLLAPVFDQICLQELFNRGLKCVYNTRPGWVSWDPTIDIYP